MKAKMRAVAQLPEQRAKRRERTKKLWQSPAYSTKLRAVMQSFEYRAEGTANT
jgi:hypothetical protein